MYRWHSAFSRSLTVAHQFTAHDDSAAQRKIGTGVGHAAGVLGLFDAEFAKSPVNCCCTHRGRSRSITVPMAR